MNKPAKKGRGQGHNKINDIKLIQMLRDNKTQKECAVFFGVTIDAIKHAKDRIMKSLDVVVPDSDDLTTDAVDSIVQLRKINEKIINQLERCDKMFKREDERTKTLDAIQEKVSAEPDDMDAHIIMDKLWTSNLKGVLAIQTNTINVSSEIRRQIELQLKIAETLFNVQMQQEFQTELIKVLRETDEFVAKKFVNRLKERRVLRGLIRLEKV